MSGMEGGSNLPEVGERHRGAHILWLLQGELSFFHASCPDSGCRHPVKGLGYFWVINKETNRTR